MEGGREDETFLPFNLHKKQFSSFHTKEKLLFASFLLLINRFERGKHWESSEKAHRKVFFFYDFSMSDGFSCLPTHCEALESGVERDEGEITF